MAAKIFKEQFCEIQKIKVCATTADLNFDNYTEAGTYEIYEDMGSGQSRVYFLTVDKSVSGACVKQTRVYCGKVETRNSTTAGAWSSWTAITGGGSGGSGEDGGYYTPSVSQEGTDIMKISFVGSKDAMPDIPYTEITLPQGAKGADGTSVTIVSVAEGQEDGGTNIVTFSDGTRLEVKNGVWGKDGADGNATYYYAGEVGTETTERVYIPDVQTGSRQLQVGDLIIDSNGKVWSVSSMSGNDAEVTYLYSIKGADGAIGEDGTSVTVKSVSESTADGGSNVVTFSDGKTLTIKNGSKGSAGAKGADGYTPVKGTDYFTEADKAEIVEDVLANSTDKVNVFQGSANVGKILVVGADGNLTLTDMPSGGGGDVVGNVDENNNIIITGDLADGTYTFKYENTDGTYAQIGSLVVSSAPKYTNVLPLAQEYATNSPYVGADGAKGYGNDMRISTSSTTTTYMKAQTGVDTTAMIPIKAGDVLRFKNCNYKVTPSNTTYGSQMILFNANKAYVTAINYNYVSQRLANFETNNGEYTSVTLTPTAAFTSAAADTWAYVMIATDGLDETSIITVNEEIV